LEEVVRKEELEVVAEAVALQLVAQELAEEPLLLEVAHKAECLLKTET
jgi:hypothetical protein